jgi:hypothetical protein
MDSTTNHNNFKMMSQDEIEAHGWNVPSLEQMSKNMDKRLKKIRGENYDDENFLMRYNYKSNYHQA